MKSLYIFCLLFCGFVTLDAQNEYQKYIALSYDELDSLLNVCYTKGQFAEGLAVAEAGRQKTRQELGEVDTRFAEFSNWKAFLYRYTGEPEKAIPLFIEAGKIFEEVKGKENKTYANLVNNLASAYADIGKYEDAQPLYIEAKDIYEKTSGKGKNYARVLNQFAGLYLRIENYDLALSLYVEARNIFEEVVGKEHYYYSTVLVNIATLYEKTAEDKLALPLYLEAIKINEKIFGKEHVRLANSLNNLAILYEKMGETDLALPLYIRSSKIMETNLGKEHPSLAISLANLGKLYMDIGNYEEALALHLQAKAIGEKAFSKNNPSFIIILNRLALIHQKMGSYEEAWKLIEDVMNRMSGLDMEHSYNQDWMDRLSKASYISNRQIVQLIYALEIVYKLLESDNSVEGAMNKQRKASDLAILLTSKLRNQISKEDDKLRILKGATVWLGRSLDLLSIEEDVDKAFKFADQNKSVLLLESTKSEEAYRLGALPDSLVWQNKKLLKTQSQLQAKLFEERPKTEKDSLRSLLNDVSEEIILWKALVKDKYPKYYKLQYEQIDAPIGDIQILLNDKTALLEYVISDSIVHIFRVDQKKVIWHQEAVLDSVLGENVKQLHQSLSDYQQLSKEKQLNYENYTQLAHWFYQKLLAPVLNEGDGIENLIIVSDGELGHLPFESFLVEAANGDSFKDLHYLLKDYNISYNYSATLWKENKDADPNANNGQMLAMAAHYDEKLEENFLRGRLPTIRQVREVLQPLPAARAEVAALEELYQGFFGFDSLATEKVLNEKAAEYAIIHLAMHGLLDEDRPMLSSLALTEDGDSLQDNFLQAHEISKMELNADLVVLSACETGYGRFEMGNGIASLARAFMYAGVPALVVSLWQVNDASTSIIMQSFYKHLAKGQSKSEALRQAKLDYIAISDKLAAHPAFWSPFILIGDESPVKIQQKGAGSWIWWAVGGGSLLILALGLGVWRKKQAA